MCRELKRSLCPTTVDVTHIWKWQRHPVQMAVRCVGWRCYYSSACLWVCGRQCIFEVWLIYVGYVRGLNVGYFSAWQLNWRFAALGREQQYARALNGIWCSGRSLCAHRQTHTKASTDRQQQRHITNTILLLISHSNWDSHNFMHHYCGEDRVAFE